MAQAVASKGVVAIGASAGGIEALTELVATLPPDLPFAVMVTVHMGQGATSVLAQILDRSGPLPAAPATHGAVLEAGRIYVAVPGNHLLAHQHRVVLSDGPWENGHRPAIDALFRSAALDYGPNAIGVLLSGLLDDGVAGLEAIRAKCGVTVAQEPADALFPDLPRNAITAGVADYTVAAKDVGGLLMQLADRSEEEAMDPDGRLELENQIAMGRRFALSVDAEELGPPTGYTCPTCKSVLMEVGENTYRCRVGHAWTNRALLLARDHELEETIWAAIRILKEKADLYRKLAEISGQSDEAERYRASAGRAEDAITVLGGSLFASQVAAD